jgi:hypothetical protein
MFIQIHKQFLASILILAGLISGTSLYSLQPTSIPIPSTTVVSQINSSANDAEERLSSGNMDLAGSQLQLGEDNNTSQLVGLRFTNVAIPDNATIVNAYLEFEVAQTDSVSTSLTIRGQAADNAPAFSSTRYDISTRPRTTTRVAWNNIPAWTTINTRWQTPNISSIIQEIVNRSNWISGNAIVIIIDGSGQRTAKSRDASAASAPKLVIDYILPTPTPTTIPSLTPSSGSTRFAVIGDYGDGSQAELDVANLLKSWNPDFVITTGDNNYPDGAANTIDAKIGQFYHEFIYPYLGAYGAGASMNRFFPSLGNHDWTTSNARPYLDYFTLPGNERYYDYVWGSVHFFVIDSDDREPDGNTSSSMQATWLHNKLAVSTSIWNIVYLHHPPYSSGSTHPSDPTLQWPFAAWGADAILAGHSHTYERIYQNGIVYFVNGLGGGSIHTFGTPVSGSQVRYNGDYGAMLVIANASQITFQFINRAGTLIDSYSLPTQTSAPSAFSKNSPSNGVINQPLNITLYWGASTNVSYYEYCIDTMNDNSCNGSWNNNNTSTSKALSGLNPNTTYYWQVRGVNSSGTTAADNGTWWSFTSVSCYTLTKSVNPSGSGVINTNPAPNCNGGTQYLSGTAVQLSASPSTGYTFSYWSVDGVLGATNQTSVTMAGNISAIANFKELNQTFDDVPPNYWAWDYIERLYADGITGGCSTFPLFYCPSALITRDQMAVFLLRAKHGSNYVPPEAIGVFEDVDPNYWAADWIEQLAAEGITTGCSLTPLLYCPTMAVTRDQMSVFLLRAKYGSSYVPPEATGVFQDVPLDYWAAAWIEQLAAEGVTGGCNTSPLQYCPSNPVSRDQMAVFLMRNFNLP